MKQIKALLTRNNESQQHQQQRDLHRDHSARTDAHPVGDPQPHADPPDEPPTCVSHPAGRACPLRMVVLTETRRVSGMCNVPARFPIDMSAPRRMTVIPMVRRSSNGSVKGQLAPSSFYCPISMELMSDPVVLATGHTYERVCIERWLQQGNRTCPVTGMRLRHLELTPNFALRVAVQASDRSASLGIRRLNTCSHLGFIERP